MAITPVFIGTWKFGIAAARVGWQALNSGATALEAIESGANVAEDDPCVNSVGYGGLPNANGIVELDAAIMDGQTHSAGAVGGLIGIGRPISVAKRVMERTPHVFLVGENAYLFARAEGFADELQLTDASLSRWKEWRSSQTGAEVSHFDTRATTRALLTPDNHDTIGVCALDAYGNLAAGCTTSGMAWKVPGRVGDSPIIGAGLYVDNEIGAAAATGHGDEMMKVCLTYRVVQSMAAGLTPQEACVEAIRYLLRKRPPQAHDEYGAAVIAIRKDGTTGSAGTVTGFRKPDRLWQWAEATASEPVLKEGPYVSETEVHDNL